MKNIQRKININEMARVIHEEEKGKIDKQFVSDLTGIVLRGGGSLAAFAVGRGVRDAYIRKNLMKSFDIQGTWNTGLGLGIFAGLGLYGLLSYLADKIQAKLEDKGMEKSAAKQKTKNILTSKLRSDLSKCKNTPDPQKCQAKIKNAIAKLKH